MRAIHADVRSSVTLITSLWITDTMLTLSVATLHDEFDFGAKRCQRFIERMNLKAECIVDDLATWDDFIGQIREELGIQIVIRRND